MRPVHSLIVVTYNRCALLREAIDSILKQTVQRWELIIVNDGSTDDTLGYLKSIQDPRIQSYTLPHGERSRARNYGIDQARGDYICVLDDDDWIEPDFLEQFEKARSSEYINHILRCRYRMVWPDRTMNPPSYSEDAYDHPIDFMCTEMCGFWTLHIPARCFKEHRFDERFPHWQDTHLIIRMVALYPFKQLNFIGYNYRQHEGMGTEGIFQSSDEMNKRLNLTLDAMNSLYLEYNVLVGPYLSEDQFQRMRAMKYLNYAVRTARRNLPNSYRFFKQALGEGFYISHAIHYLRWIVYYIWYSRVGLQPNGEV